MEHYKPHPNATFEGYYNKFDMPSGAKLILIISRVPNTGDRANYVSFTYIPNAASSSSSSSDVRLAQHNKIFQREFWPKTLNFTEHSSRDGFVLATTDGLVEFSIRGSKGTYALKSDEGLTFRAEFESTTPWSRARGGAESSTPESWLVNLPLPLHWHVQSLATPATFSLELPTTGIDDEEYARAEKIVSSQDRRGEAIIHQEKNWAISFPASHMWIQARRHGDNPSGINLAGGQVIGTEAFLVGYRNERAGVDIDFRPPFAMRIPIPLSSYLVAGGLGIGPFMSFTKDWSRRTFSLDVSSFTERLEVRASAPEGSFYALSAPFDDGHRKNFLAQSMLARIEVKVSRRRWWIAGPWETVCEEVFEGGALEFGGEYYPPKGSDEIAH